MKLTHKRIRRGGVVAACLVALAVPSAASAETALNIPSWTLHPDFVSTYGQFEADNTYVSFRWHVDTAHSTRVSANNCRNYDQVYGLVDYTAHAQNYATIWPNSSNFACFALRGRSLYGLQTSLDGYLLYVH